MNDSLGARIIKHGFCAACTAALFAAAVILTGELLHRRAVDVAMTTDAQLISFSPTR